MLIRKYLPGDEARIKSVYKVCFSGPPWNQEVTEEEAEARWADHSSRAGFVCFVATENEQVIGASWFDTISLEELARERGDDLVAFVTSLGSMLPAVWIRETIVDPRFQGKRIASQLKEWAVRDIAERLSHTILLTRLRDDNTKIIRANEKLGFRRTGVRVASRGTPGLSHEYWYFVL